MTARRGLLELVLPLAALAALATAMERTDLDFAITDRFHDFATHRWTLRASWFVDVGMHRGARDVVVVVGLVALAALISGAFVPSMRRHGRCAAYVLVCMAVGPVLVATLKALCNCHCPWDMARYGGHLACAPCAEPFFQLAGHGKCFPSGHAAGGYTLLSLHYAGRARSRAAGLIGLAIGAVAGTVMGLVQVARGAHFPSHMVWSAAVCWAVCVMAQAWLPCPNLSAGQDVSEPASSIGSSWASRA